MSGIGDGLDARLAALGAAMVAPVAAASPRRLVAHAFDALPARATLADLDALRRAWLADRERDPLRRLVAEDLQLVLDHVEPIAQRLDAWRDPARALAGARDAMVTALAARGLAMRVPELHVAPRLPPGYDVPFLHAVSLDASDATHLGVAAGIHFDGRRLAPLASECTLGHVMIHAALGERSPELLGRGLEEGACEVLGCLLAAGDVLTLPVATSVFEATRLTGGASPARLDLLRETGRAALVHRAHGVAGLVALVGEGRSAIKHAERALAAGDLAVPGLARAEPDRALQDALDRVLLARGRPLVVPARAFVVARALAGGEGVAEAARGLGITHAEALASARELQDGPFVLILSADGRVLVHDLPLVLGTRALRYAIDARPWTNGEARP